MWQAAIMLQLEQKCRTTALHNLAIKPCVQHGCCDEKKEIRKHGNKHNPNKALVLLSPLVLDKGLKHLRLLPFFLEWLPLERTNAILRVEQS